jgi:hypothetical protein
MSLMITVGLIRKRSEDFQSDGASINLTAELDQPLLARPEALQAQIDALYEQADQALAFRSFQAMSQERSPSQIHSRPSAGGQMAMPNVGICESRASEARKNPKSNGNVNGSVRMTNSQRRAINVIANAMGIDPLREALDLLGVELDQLSIRQASELIDHLKAQSST